MIVREFNTSQDYNEVAGWWAKQDWPVLPTNILTTSGFIVESESQKLAATWIFKTNCPIYIMEWTVGNPDVSWESRAAAINMATSAACDWAKNDGASHVMTMTKSKRFIDKLNESGFKVTDTDMTHLIRSL